MGRLRSHPGKVFPRSGLFDKSKEILVRISEVKFHSFLNEQHLLEKN
jgi:hypothetical protein